MHEERQEPLYPEPMPKKGTGGFSKTGKGMMELIVVLLTVSELTIFLSMWFSGNLAYAFIPLFCPFMAAIVIGLAFGARHRYTVQATVQSLSVSILLLGLDGSDLAWSWSFVAVGGIVLFWVIAVLPAFVRMRGKLGLSFLLSVATTLGYVAFLNWFVKGTLTWFVPVALPSAAVLLLGILAMHLRFFRKNRSRMPLADMVFFVLIVLFLTISAADLFSARYLLGIWKLRWSVSMLSAAVILSVFLASVSLSRRVRRYFTSQNRHS
jgi:hypothetical protein